MPRGAASRAATFSAAADAFSRGWAVGADAKRRRKEDERQDRRVGLEENQDRREQGRYDAEMRDHDLNAAVRAKKREALASEIDMDLEMKRDAMKRMSEAEAAFGKFTAGADLIDWGSPDAPTQYEALTRQYLPGILRHDQIAKKWEALDGVAKKSQAFTAHKIMEQGLMKALTEAAQVAPDVLLAPPTRADGTPDFEAIRNTVRERQKEIDQQAVELRKVGRAPQRATISNSQKMEMELIRDELKDVNKSILEMDASGRGNPDARLQLQNRKSSLMKQLRRFDAMEAPAASDGPGTSDAPEETRIEEAPGQTQRGNPRQFRQGRFKISVEE